MKELKNIKYNLALIGCGDIAAQYIDASVITKNVRIVKLVDVHQENAKSLGNLYKIPWTTSYEEVLEDKDISGVIICTPHYLHYPLTKKAAEAGKQILCDKPISSSVQDGEAMIRLCREHSVSLSINYALRFNKYAKRAKEILDTGCLGKIYFIKNEILCNKGEEYWEKGWNKRVATDWRRSLEKAGGGVLLMNSSHYIDMLHYITGLKACSVVGYSGTYGQYEKRIEVEDTAIGVMKLENGGVMQITALSSFLPTLKDVSLIIGENGTLDFSTNRDTRLFLKEPFDQYPALEWIEIKADDVNDQHYTRYLEKWAEMQENNSGVPISGEDALYALKVVKDIYGFSNGF